MCGIVGYCGRDAARLVYEGLKRVEYRGYDSAGIAVENNGVVIIRKDVGTLREVNQKHRLSGMAGDIAIGHTRWCTHGKVSQINAHPHCDCKGRVVVVHNGIIENYQELKRELAGHRFLSDTDTEVIPHLVEDELGKGYSLEGAVRLACKRIAGSYAFLVIAGESKIVATRHGVPLVVGIGEDGNFVASDALSFLSYTNKVLNLENGEIAVVSPKGVILLDSSGDRIVRDAVQVTNESWEYTKKGFPHYMLKEINELPQSVSSTTLQDKQLFTGIAMDVLRARQVVITACGTSRYAALVGRYLFSKVSRKFCDVVMASEFHYFADSIDRDTLVLAVSQSGETADVVEGVSRARAMGARVVSIVNRPLSILEGMSHDVIRLNCGVEVAVPATKSFLSQVVVFYLLAYSMVNAFDEAVEGIKNAGSKLPQIIHDNDKRLADLVESLAGKNDWYFIARGINFALASEGALKLKEVSYVHAEGMPAGELKHGTLSLVEEGTPILLICPDDYTYSETMANAMEAKSRGGYVIAVSDEYNECYDCWVRIPKVEEIYYPLVCVAPLYLLAYRMALAKGLNPDMPRNLAKSVTVK